MFGAENCGEPVASFKRKSLELLQLFLAYQLAGGSAIASIKALTREALNEYPACASDFDQAAAETIKAIQREQLNRMHSSKQKVS